MDIFSCFSFCKNKSTVNDSETKFQNSNLIDNKSHGKNNEAPLASNNNNTNRLETKYDNNFNITDREELSIVNYFNPRTGQYQRMFVRKRKIVDDEL
jgi:hypothetical protein